MHNNNKKLWSFVVGCTLVWASVWIVDFAISAPVPESFQTNTNFVVYYYPMMVSALLTSVFSLFVVWILSKVIKLKINEHFVWLSIPSLMFLIFSVVVAHTYNGLIYSALIPILFVLCITGVIEKRDAYLPERLKVW
ncbi:hypothetical protein HII17_04815 [Thalassotalea sp. M1531]|uniref:Uncharacterized protein n=1 Tax=Thalassotalea algicola TaxID=2716224 RepID=A0A7Y0LAZ3_9GAMM|nr:hypothetical protein [Thalassotalea algicola]NMP30878.1 hypothetical protein [Thalassotalea algicola]